jgi:hypothetical protein
MDSEPQVDQQAILELITHSYREIFGDYRGEFGLLDPKLWWKDFQVDYVLEVILANFAIVNLTCERAMEASSALEDSEEEDLGEWFLDYDMGYRLAEDCTEVISFAMNQEIEVRDSLIDELFYAHVQYFNMSNTAGRQGWFDVNKRLSNSMVQLLEFRPTLLELVDEWRQGIGDLDLEYPDSEDMPEELRWKREFTDFLIENTQQD